MTSRRLISCLRPSIKAYYGLSQDRILLCRYFSSLSTSQTNYADRFSNINGTLNVTQKRNYPKGKEKVKNTVKKIEIREDIIAEHVNVKKFKLELEETLNSLKDQYIRSVSLRSSSGAIEALPFEFEGEKYTIRDLAQINRKNPKLIALNFASFPHTIPIVLQTLNESGMNLNPQQDGTSIYIPVPKVTREHRENLAKNANSIFNKCKVSIKDVVSKYLKRLESKENEGLSKEMFLILREQITAIANQYLSQAEKMKQDKTKELLGDS